MGVTISSNSAVTYEPIKTYTTTAATSSYTFTSIPTTYTDLVVVIGGTGDSNGYLYIQVGNGSVDTGSNYSRTYMSGNGSSASSARSTNEVGFFMDAGNGSSSTPSDTVFSIMNYSNTTTYKTMLLRAYSYLAPGPYAGVYLWRGTSAIDTLKINASSGTSIQTGTVISLYGIKAA